MNELYEKLGNNIKFFREQKNLTQKQLGEAIYKSEILIRKYESGNTKIPFSSIMSISSVFNITPIELFFINGETPEHAEIEKIAKILKVTPDDLMKNTTVENFKTPKYIKEIATNHTQETKENENKIYSIDDLFEKFNIDESIIELAKISKLSTDIVDKIFSPYRKGYNNDDVIALCKALKLSDDQINEWLLFNDAKPYENRQLIESSYWQHCIINYPYGNIEGINILELKIAQLKEISKELDNRFKQKLIEITQK